jgi:CRISPR-associated protein Cas2
MSPVQSVTHVSGLYPLITPTVFSQPPPRPPGEEGEESRRWDRRRTRLAHALKDFGERVQLSVFECQLDERQTASLCARLAKLIEPEEDSVRVYRLCSDCKTRLELLGISSRTEDPPVFVL